MAIDKYRAISFDCFGTLVDWESGIINSIRESCHRVCSAIANEDLIARFLAHETTILFQTPEIPYRVALAKTFEKVLTELGVRCSPEQSSRFGESVHKWPLFHDTIDALSYLAGFHELVILSNIDDVSIEMTKKRLNCSFLHTYTAQSIGSFKPSVNNFKYLIDGLAKSGFPKESILHVSVSRFHDIEPAAIQGIDTAWINRANTLNGTLSIHSDFKPGHEPSYQFQSLSELVFFHKNSISD